MPALRTLLLSTLLALAWLPLTAAAEPDCGALNDPVYHRVNPSSQANLLTTSLNEAENAEANYGFTDDRGAPVSASRTPASGLVPVYRLYKASSSDFVWTAKHAEVASAVAKHGYVNQGPNFYASFTAAACTQPVYRFLKGNKHRHAFSESERSALLAAGWTAEGISFHAKPASAPVDAVFSFAVIPDTQNEVFGTGVRYVDRANWLAANKTTLDLRFVLHSGDITNWGERDEPQYQVASSGLAALEQAGIPYAFTPGNHVTRAVCAGGSACPGESASVNVRLLPLFNQYFNPRFAVSGRMEPDKVDNYYTLFEAGGVDWLVLSLELWPRTAVVDWAKTVLAAHPSHNVIIVTHMYLNGDGSISTSNGGYGANSPKYLYDNLVSRYANVRFVFSGHTGQAAMRTDTGVNGNRIASFLQSFHAQSNPVRIVEIDTTQNEATSWIYAPSAPGTDFSAYDAVVTGLDLIR